MARAVMGSVKRIVIREEPTETDFGKGTFEFTNDYSVFDYGKMPDTIPNKGECICRMSSYNFKKLEEQGVKTHFIGNPTPDTIDFKVVRILYPGKDTITSETGNFLVPLEVIFRNTLPEGSSVFKRLESGQIKPEDIGLTEMPTPGAKLETPIIDLSTKLEPTDRYLDEAEAKQISSLSDEEFENMKATAMKINDFLTQQAESKGLVHADGKVEFIMSPDRELMLGDVVGTADENRFLYKGTHLSKQLARDYYRLGDWPNQVKQAFAEKKDLPAPEPLPAEAVTILGHAYQSLCETWTGEKVWNAPSLDEVVANYNAFMDKAGKEASS